MVTENMFGDILSDLGARRLWGEWALRLRRISAIDHAVFQPSHGSAPTIAGQRNRQSRRATILSVAMMLEWFGDRHRRAGLLARRPRLDARDRTDVRRWNAGRCRARRRFRNCQDNGTRQARARDWGLRESGAGSVIGDRDRDQGERDRGVKDRRSESVLRFRFCNPGGRNPGSTASDPGRGPVDQRAVAAQDLGRAPSLLRYWFRSMLSRLKVRQMFRRGETRLHVAIAVDRNRVGHCRRSRADGRCAAASRRISGRGACPLRLGAARDDEGAGAAAA